MDEKHLEGNWKVDSFSVFVYDSISGYHIDTAYTNDGNITFDYEFKNCNGGGYMTFRKNDGTPYVFTFSITDYSPNSRRFFTLSGPSLDGHPDTYYERLEANYYDDGMTLESTNLARNYGWGTTHPQLLRFWNFKLTR